MGSYAETLLAPGEVVVHRSRQHWLALILDSRAAALLWGITIILLLVNVFLDLGDGIETALFWALVVTLIGGVIVVAWRWWHFRTEEYLITNRRLMKVSGIINKRSGDSSLEKINDAILEENLLGRMLDYGDLDILTAAEVAVDRYRMLNHAKEFKKAMLGAKHALETGQSFGDIPASPQATVAPASPPTAGTSPSPATTPPAMAPAPVDRIDTAEEVTTALARLAELRDKGAITSGEYEVKKRELLGRL